MRKTTIKDISVIEDLLPWSSDCFAHQERNSEKPEDLILRDTSRSYLHKSPRKWERERERKVKHMISRIQIKVRKPQHLALTSRSLQNFRLVSTVSQPQKWYTTHILKTLTKYNGTGEFRGAY